MSKYPVRHEKIKGGETFLRDGKVAVGVVLGIFLSLLAYFWLDFYPRDITRNDYIEMLPIVISLIVAGASTFLAANALMEQRQSREAATDPVLVAHFGQREDARELVTFRLSNIGAGAALNVYMEIKKPATDLEKYKLLTNIFERHYPFRVIQQDKAVEFSLAFGWDLLNADPPLPPFEVNIRYEDLLGGEYKGRFLLDVREMEKLGAERSVQMRLVRAVENLAKTK